MFGVGGNASTKTKEKKRKRHEKKQKMRGIVERYKARGFHFVTSGRSDPSDDGD